MAKAEYRITLDDGVNPLVLQNNPVNILKRQTEYVENERYGTIFRSISGTIRFTLSGRDYLIALKNAKGIDAECSIKIERLNNSTQGYENPRYGVIDFEKWNDVSKSKFLDVNIIDGLDLQKLFNRENLQINVTSSEDVDGKAITDPLGIFKQVNLPQINPPFWALGDGGITILKSYNPPSSSTEDLFFQGSTSFNNIGADFDDDTLIYTNSTGADVDSVYRHEISADMTITSNNVDVGIGMGVKIELIRIDTDHVVDTFSRSIQTSGQFFAADSFFVSGVVNAVIPNGGQQGHKFRITITPAGGAPTQGTLIISISSTITDVDFSYTDSVILPDTAVNMIKPLDLGNRILKQIGVDGALTSSVFSSRFIAPFEYLMFTGGKHVRQFPIETPINTSFSDYIQGYASVLGLIFLYENGVFKLEYYNYRYGQTTPSITISQFSKVEELTDNDAYFNKVLIGYNNNEYSDIKGNIEFNTEFEYSTINKKKNEINKICNYRADSLGYKQLLENGYSTQGTEDIDGENDNYILSSLESGGLINVKKASDIGTVTGTRGVETYYNLEITPKQNLTRHAFLLETTLYYLNKEAKYIRSKNNIPLVINGLAELDGNYYQNFQKVIKTKPFNWKLETVLTDELLNFLETTPNNLMRFTGLGDVFLKGATVEEHDKTVTLTLKQT
jgi:hypothetical protein